MAPAGTTKGSQHIEQLMQQLPPDSERYQVLVTARQFKSSWVELGEWLARVSGSGRFAEWGYASFEEYCTREVRIRRQTAEKLLLAFRFLEHREPTLLQRKEERPLPDYRTVDLLRQADEQEQFSMAEYRELRQAAIEEERSHATLSRQFRDMTMAHQPDLMARQKNRNALLAARRLSTSLCEITDVPAPLVQAVDELVGFLETRQAEHGEAV